MIYWKKMTTKVVVVGRWWQPAVAAAMAVHPSHSYVQNKDKERGNDCTDERDNLPPHRILIFADFGNSGDPVFPAIKSPAVQFR